MRDAIVPDSMSSCMHCRLCRRSWSALYQPVQARNQAERAKRCTTVFDYYTLVQFIRCGHHCALNSAAIVQYSTPSPGGDTKHLLYGRCLSAIHYCFYCGLQCAVLFSKSER